MKVDTSKCFKKCEGIDIVSYDKEEIESKLTRRFSTLLEELNKAGFDNNLKLTRRISKLSDQYNRYIETFNFSRKYKGIDS